MTARELIEQRNDLKRALAGHEPQDIINGLHKEINDLKAEIMNLKKGKKIKPNESNITKAIKMTVELTGLIASLSGDELVRVGEAKSLFDGLDDLWSTVEGYADYLDGTLKKAIASEIMRKVK